MIFLSLSLVKKKKDKEIVPNWNTVIWRDDSELTRACEVVNTCLYYKEKHVANLRYFTRVFLSSSEQEEGKTTAFDYSAFIPVLRFLFSYSFFWCIFGRRLLFWQCHFLSGLFGKLYERAHWSVFPFLFFFFCKIVSGKMYTRKKLPVTWYIIIFLNRILILSFYLFDISYQDI